KRDDSAATSDGNERQADGAAYHRIDDAGAEYQQGLFHQRITGCDHGADGPNRIGPADLVHHQPEHRGCKEDAHSVVNAVHVSSDEAVESFYHIFPQSAETLSSNWNFESGLCCPLTHGFEAHFLSGDTPSPFWSRPARASPARPAAAR